MKALVIAAALAAAPALATETCPDTPKDKWLRPEEVQARMEKLGYDVRRVKKEGSASRRGRNTFASAPALKTRSARCA